MNNTRELLQQYQSTMDGKYLEAVIERVSPSLRLYLKAMVPSRDVEDVMQEVCHRVHKRIPRYDGNLGGVTWITKIADGAAKSHEARRLRKKRGGHIKHHSIDFVVHAADQHEGTEWNHPECGDLGPVESIEEKERSAAVRAFMDTLQDKDRMLIDLIFFQGLSRPEVAKRMDIPLGTVSSRRDYLFTRLKRVVAKLEPVA